MSGLLGLMDSSGTITLVREISCGGAGEEADGIPCGSAPRPGMELRRVPGCSAEKAALGLGVALDLCWRSRSVGLD